MIWYSVPNFLVFSYTLFLNVILLVALHKYLINIKIVYFSLFTLNETVCFSKNEMF